MQRYGQSKPGEILVSRVVTDLVAGASLMFSLSRQLQHDSVAPVYSLDRPIGTQPLESPLDGIAQALVRADHADGDIPVQARFALVAIQDPDGLVRMLQVVVTGNGRGDRCRVDLMVGERLD